MGLGFEILFQAKRFEDERMTAGFWLVNFLK
jgi:hypothetical protein